MRGKIDHLPGPKGHHVDISKEKLEAQLVSGKAQCHARTILVILFSLFGQLEPLVIVDIGSNGKIFCFI